MLQQSVQDDSALRQLIALHDLSLKALTAKNTDEILKRGVEVLEEAFYAALARVWLTQADGTLMLKASAGISHRTVDSSRYIIDPKSCTHKIGRVANTRVPFVSNQIVGHEEFEQEWVEKEGLVAAAVFPLLNCDQLEGVMAIFSRQPLGPVEQQALATFAAHLTLAVRQTILREEMVRQERLATLGQLAGAIAHDLRAPLARITTSIELLNEPLEQMPEQYKYLEFISRATNDMGEIIGSLLDYARMVALGRTGCDLRELMQEVLFEMAIPDTIDVSTDLSQITSSIMINSIQMKRVFMNLIKNAIEAMPDGGALKISGAEQNSSTSISISDTGSGIEAENLEKIFSPLFTKTVRGTGFGLAASRSIVEAHGGKLEVVSELGSGSTFIISLPHSEL